MFVSPAMGLDIWSSTADPYSSEQLANNFERIDQHSHSEGEGVQIPTAGIRNEAITTEKIAKESITSEKISGGALSEVIPTGSIYAYAAKTAPAGFLICNGEAINRTIYAKLFDVIGIIWGSGDGSTTFNLPNLQNKFLLGTSATYPLATIGGNAEITKTLTTNNIPSHSHTIECGRGAPNVATEDKQYPHLPLIPEYLGGVLYEGREYTNVLPTQFHEPNFPTSHAGSGQAFSLNIMPPYIAVTWIIKT